ncbi:MAG TPA: hypothetical protein VFV21_11450 [Arenimonas sp.]|nr:hypothetical protein [Arenimonas sp.]HEX4854766.1 hypothetical protein [Arenimonas sp.]
MRKKDAEGRRERLKYDWPGRLFSVALDRYLRPNMVGRMPQHALAAFFVEMDKHGKLAFRVSSI